MVRTLILGGGFGGITVATELHRHLGAEHEIVLVDRSPDFVMGLRKLWELVGKGSLEEGTRSRALLDRPGVSFLQREIVSIDPAARSVETDAGPLDGDFMVVALGAVPRPDLVPGLSEYGHDVWDPRNVPAAAAALDGLTEGRIAIVIAGVPYTCPPAPYECVMLLDDYLRTSGLRGDIDLVVTMVKPLLMPNAGVEGSTWLARELDARGIEHHTGREVERVEAGRVVFTDSELEFDLLIGVPPHRPPAVIADSGLAGQTPWIEVDPGTLRTSFDGVYAIGDVTKITLANGLALPKAGLMAELEGQRVAAAIAAEVRGGDTPPEFDGQGYCFLETGMDSAALIKGDFFATPEPDVRIGDISPMNASDKHFFEMNRLTSWFDASE